MNANNPRLELVAAIADEAMAAIDGHRQVSPFSSRFTDFDFEAAYAVTAELRRRREQRGDGQLGRKIGFTNRGIWAQFGVDRPMWGDVYGTTLHRLANLAEPFSIMGLPEPLIEPEIVFKLSAAPCRGMDESALLGCIEWVAPGFEIVQSIFPGWRFKAPDTVAAGGLHAALLLGRTHRVESMRIAELRQALTTFTIELRRDGVAIDHGRAVNVLDGPLLALRHLVELLAGDRSNPSLRAGEIVSTGTLTRAFPILPGQTWTGVFSGIALDDISVTFG